MSEYKATIKMIFEDNVDGVTFLPTTSSDVHLTGFNYTKKSKYEISELGHLYHIMIYKSDEDGMVTAPDNFVAVLTEPYVYVSHLVDCGFFGIVVKKTKRSKKIVNDIYKKVMRMFRDQNQL